ncbi:MAG: hypothetical protein RLZZ450_4413 [Pseudomonadota bacterium]|jgi:hypothetical protein
MRWARVTACLLVLAATLACGSDGPSGRPVLNRCAQDFECDKLDACSSELGMCVHANVERPYLAAIQVTPSNVPGSPTLRRVTRAPDLLTQTFNYNLGVIRVQRVVRVSGSVRDDVGRTMEAEVAFVPSTRSYLVGGVSAFTQSAGLGQGAPGPQDFAASLDPATAYDVTVFPLGRDSEQFPPANFALPATGVDLHVNFDYPPQDLLRAKLVDENQKPANTDWKVRLRRKSTGEITSSVGKVQGGGMFQIRAPKAALTPEALAEQELVLEVGNRGDPQLVAIAFAGERLRDGGTLVMPTIPSPVSYSGAVEIAELPNAPRDQNTIHADLTFVSNFAIPNESGDLRDRDWCRLRLPGSPQGTFTCSAMLTASVGADRTVNTRLLPGDYQLFVAPTGDATDKLRVATSQLQAQVRTQPNGDNQEGTAFRVSRATQFKGLVLTPEARPMPAVTVTANALGLQRDLDAVALYNRTAAQTSDKRGAFELAVDRGYYDLLAVPPEGSGFAWVLKDNRRISGERDTTVNSLSAIAPQVPVVTTGFLQTTDNKPVVGARVEAFAIVDNLDPNRPGQRAVRIATAVSSATGSFELLLPQSIGEGEVVSSLDGGVRIDQSPSTAADASTGAIRVVALDAGP